MGKEVIPVVSKHILRSRISTECYHSSHHQRCIEEYLCVGIAIAAISASAIRASYYLEVVHLMILTPQNPVITTRGTSLTAVPTFSISVLILVVGLWIALLSLILKLPCQL
jgi:NADH:ubiquinone oxidoreductase subunit 2 (subunit N)